MATPTSLIHGIENSILIYYLPRVLVAIGILIAANYLGAFVAKLINHAVKRAGKGLRAPNTTKLLIKSLFVFIAIMIIIGEFDINLWPLLTSLGVAGIIIGLALQAPLGNFFSGLMVILTDAVNEGDSLDVNGMSGTVHAVKFNHTIIDTWDGKRIHIPNSSVWSSNITKYWPKLARRIDMPIGVPYSLKPEQLEAVPELLKKLLQEEPLVYKGPLSDEDPVVTNYVTFDGFGSSSVNFSIHFWVLRNDYFDAQIAMGIDIFREFTKMNISIPYNQLDIHVDGEMNFKNRSKKDD
jgi:small conductance mechanosensitive channel